MRELECHCYKINRSSDVRIAMISMYRMDYYPDLTTNERVSLGTIIAELGSNIVKYGVAGTIQICRVEDGSKNGFLVEAKDHGPGIPDVERSLQDHFSTGNTLGLGLPAVKRMSDELSIDSTADRGTHGRALRWVKSKTAHQRQLPLATTSTTTINGGNHGDGSLPQSSGRTPCRLSIESRSRAHHTERLGGDQILALQQGDLWLHAIVDGCGHGPKAHAVACGIVAALGERFAQLTASLDQKRQAVSGEIWLTDLLRTAHEQAGSGRGAIGLSLIDGRQWKLWFSGIGNTRIVQYKPKGWSGVSRDGQLGDRFPTPLVQCFPLENDDTVVQFSDGLRESQVRSLRKKIGPAPSPAAIADDLLQHGSSGDDVSVLVMQCQQ